MNKTLNQWLSSYFSSNNFTCSPLPGDASFRRYYRIGHGGKTWIAMDATAERDRCPQFINIANLLRANQLIAPEIFAADLEQGFLLLTDFGDQLFLSALSENNAEILYGRALDSLALISRCQGNENFIPPLFTAEIMRNELALCQEWYLEKYLNLFVSEQDQKLLSQCFDLIVKRCAAQPYVFMHRDYHSANLMVLPDNQVGILDFQDAFQGPVTYDLVSLLRDCYISWPPQLVERLVLNYKEKLNVKISNDEFLYWFDWMGVQRHLKALLTFSRKCKRDNNSNYLQHIPRTVQYILHACDKYSELNSLKNFLQIEERATCVR
jgi:aminoglycoside/choline kinase family phosphotransferase